MIHDAPLPPLAELLESAHVVTLSLAQRFRRVDEREIVILTGPHGASEFSPFVEYPDAEAAAWLRAAIEFGWTPTPPTRRASIPVNATLPAVPPERVGAVLERYGRFRTVKVKVAERGQSLDDDVARTAEVRRLLGPEGRIRLDANGGWGLDAAEHAIRALERFDLEYVEQPCASVAELAQLRERVRRLGIPIAADESVRKAEDPLLVARAGAADLLVIKAQPLGGIRSALAIAEKAGLPVVVSSALDSSVGLAMGAHLAAALHELDYDCGLGTAALLATDVTRDRMLPRGGEIPVRRVEPEPALLAEHRASPEREAWWRERITRCYALLQASAP